MSRFGDDPGGRRTIGHREIALQEWSRTRGQRPSGRIGMIEIVVNPAEMGNHAKLIQKHECGQGIIYIPTGKLNDFFVAQRKGETNAQTVLRLVLEGRWDGFTK